MIYVIDDGGGKYSDQHIYFVYVRTPAEGALLERAVKLRASLGTYSTEDAHVTLVAESVEWRDGKPCALREAIEDLLPEYQHEGEPTWLAYCAIMADLKATS